MSALDGDLPSAQQAAQCVQDLGVDQVRGVQVAVVGEALDEFGGRVAGGERFEHR